MRSSHRTCMPAAARALLCGREGGPQTVNIYARTHIYARMHPHVCTHLANLFFPPAFFLLQTFRLELLKDLSPIGAAADLECGVDLVNVRVSGQANTGPTTYTCDSCQVRAPCPSAVMARL